MVLGCQGESNQTSEHQGQRLHPSQARGRWGHHNSMMSLRKEVWTCSVFVCVWFEDVSVYIEAQEREREAEMERLT